MLKKEHAAVAWENSSQPRGAGPLNKAKFKLTLNQA